MGHVDSKSAHGVFYRLDQLKPGTDVELEGRHARQGYKLKLTVLERPTQTAQAR